MCTMSLRVSRRTVITRLINSSGGRLIPFIKRSRTNQLLIAIRFRESRTFFAIPFPSRRNRREFSCILEADVFGPYSSIENAYYDVGSQTRWAPESLSFFQAKEVRGVGGMESEELIRDGGEESLGVPEGFEVVR